MRPVSAKGQLVLSDYISDGGGHLTDALTVLTGGGTISETLMPVRPEA